MIIVGELINASRKTVREIIEKQDAAGVAKLAKDQKEHGAHYIDVNAGVFVGREAELLKWLVSSVQGAVESPCCIDSPDPKAIEMALSIHKGTAMINSISLEKDRYEKLLPVVAGTKSKVVALCMSDEGMPETADQRITIADKLINGLVKSNVPLEDIYVDPLVQPVSTNNAFGVEFLQAIERIVLTFKGVHTMCGLSNISFGLPERKFINQTFMVMAINKGLDGAIINPLDKRMMGCITTAEMLAGKDSYCMNYLKGTERAYSPVETRRTKSHRYPGSQIRDRAERTGDAGSVEDRRSPQESQRGRTGTLCGTRHLRRKGAVLMVPGEDSRQ